MFDETPILTFKSAMLDLDRLRHDLQLGREHPARESFDHRIALILRSVRRHGPLPGHRPRAESTSRRLQSIIIQAEHRLSLDESDLALDSVLKGLRLRVNDPYLLFLGARAVNELGSDESAARLAYQALWVHPGFTEVQHFFSELSQVHPGISEEFFGRPSP